MRRALAWLVLAFALLFSARGQAAGQPTGIAPQTYALAPPPSSGDDGAPLTTALAVATKRGVPLYLQARAYALTASITAANYNGYAPKVYGQPGTSITMNMSSSGAGGTNNAAFFGPYTTPGGAFSTTLAANTALNSPTISTHSKPSVGMWLYLSNGGVTNVGFYCLVQASTGSSDPYTVTCRDPVPYPETLVSGSTAAQQNPLVGFEIHGGGMLITGTGAAGDRVIETACVGCKFEGINVDKSGGSLPGSILMSCDIGSSRCTFDSINVDCGGSCLTAVACESAQNCLINNVRVSNGGNSATAGFYLPDATDSVVSNSSAHNFYVGALVTTGAVPSTTQGSRRIKIVNSSFTGNSNAGVQIQSPETTVEDCSFAGNPGHGVMVGFGSALSLPSGKPAQLIGVTGQSNKGALIHVTGGDVNVSTFTSSDDGVSATLAAVNIPSGASNVTLSNGYITLVSDVAQYGVFAAGSGRIRMQDMTFAYPASPASASACMVSHGTNILDVSRTRCDGGYFGFYLYGSPASTYYQGPGVTLTGTQTGGDLTVNAGSFTNRGTVTCNGVTPVDFSLPAIKARSTVTLTRKTAGVTPCTVAPTYTVTAGTKASVTCVTASCNDTVSIVVDGLSVAGQRRPLEGAGLVALALLGLVALRRRKPSNDNAVNHFGRGAGSTSAR